jgi:hypothetical protein
MSSDMDEHQNKYIDMPLPERIIASIKNATILMADTSDSLHLYSVRDWVYWVSRSKATNRSGPWSDLKKAIEAEGDFKVSEILRVLDIETPGGKQRMEFTDEEGLYQITQRMSDRSKAVRDVKRYLAQSGVFMGEAYRNPEAAADEIVTSAYAREYRKLRAEGFDATEAQEWLDVRAKQKQQRGIITRIWHRRGIHSPLDFANLTNQIHRVALGRTATNHKRELAVKDTPRNYVSAADNATIQITEFTSGLLHDHRESYGKVELAEDIEDVRPIIDSARPDIQRVFSQKPRRLPGSKPPDLPE